MKNLVLASKSPRRSEILKKAGFKFDIVTSDYEEELDNKQFSYDKIENLAKNKAFGALNNINKPSYIISADTVVVLDNKILGKPDGYDGAFKMLKSLSGRTHIVVTSIVVMNSETGEFKKNSTTSEVTFEKLTDEQIKYYIDNFKPFDKAGSYGIQEMPAGYIKSYTGDLENIIGISSKSLAELLSIKV